MGGKTSIEKYWCEEAKKYDQYEDFVKYYFNSNKVDTVCEFCGHKTVNYKKCEYGECKRVATIGPDISDVIYDMDIYPMYCDNHVYRKKMYCTEPRKIGYKEVPLDHYRRCRSLKKIWAESKLKGK